MTTNKSPLLFLLIVFSSAIGCAKVTETIDQHHPFHSNGTIHLGNINGAVEISSWDRDEVRIVAVKSGRSRKDLERIHVEIDARPEKLVVRTRHEKAGWLFWRRDPKGGVEYVLKVPAGVTLERVDTVNSTVICDGVTGPVSISTVNGNVDVRGLAAPASLHAVNGRLLARFSAVDPSGGIELSTVNGACEIHLPTDSDARLKARTINGVVECDLPLTDMESGRHSLQGTLGNGQTPIELSTVNGGIRIRNAQG